MNLWYQKNTTSKALLVLVLPSRRAWLFLHSRRRSSSQAKVAEQKASSWVKLTEKKKVGIEANEWHFVAVVKEVGGFSNSLLVHVKLSTSALRVLFSFFIRNLQLKERNNFIPTRLKMLCERYEPNVYRWNTKSKVWNHTFFPPSQIFNETNETTGSSGT